MLHLLLGRDWIANRNVILNQIAKDVHNRKGNRILIVPELISHEMERSLCACAGDTASRYAEVLSFTRLARRVCDSMGSAAPECMDNGGRLVAVAAAARQLSSRLKAYAAIETKPEFLSGLIDALDEFKRCCISSQDLKNASREAEGSLAQKLEELSLLMEAYDSLCSRGKRDPRDQMTWLLEQLEEGNFAQEHIFYIDGFPDFTRQNMAIIEHLIMESEEVTISLNCDCVDSSLLAYEKAGATAKEICQRARKAGIEVKITVVPERKDQLQSVRGRLYQGPISRASAQNVLQVYRSESAYMECMGAAEQVLELVKNGARFRDITLVCSDMTVYQPLLDLIFHRFRIPIYRSGTEEILQKTVISTVLAALEAVLSGFDQKNVLRYLRSALSPVSMDICDHVENYAIIWGIRGNKWAENWTNHPDGLSAERTETSDALLGQINEARAAAISPLVKLQKEFRNAKVLCDQVKALYGFLEDLRLEERLSELAREMDRSGDNRSAQILNQLWEILINAMEQMYDVLGNTQWESEHFLCLFRLLLSQYDVGTIPPVLDAVQMGPVTAMRCHEGKHLILLGAEEGKLPGYSGSAGVLSDQERVALRELGVPLTGGAMEGIQAEFAEIYGVFCGATESVRVFCSSEQPSFLYRRLLEMSGTLATADSSIGFAVADPFEAAAYLSGWSAETEARRLNLETYYHEAIQMRDYQLGKVEKDTIRKLYGSTLNLSASQIDRQAECRLSYFLKYGLRVKERKEATVDPAEFGTYVHAVLENTVRCIRDLGGFHCVTLEETLEMAHRFSDEYAAEHFSQLDSERMTYLFKRNTQELDMVVAELWQELSESLFEPADVEVNFGAAGELPPIAIPNHSMNALLRGFIDRVDTWNTAGSSYYRVVDYKTGRKDFDYCDVFNGVGLQMLLYMFALRSSGSAILGDHPVAAGVQYFPARAPYITAEGRLNEQEAEQERSAQWKRRGLLLRDEEVLQAMEPGEAPERMCYTVRKDGSLSGDLADRDQMKLLEQYVFHVLAEMVDDIASGNVEANPYTRGSSHNACAYCPYGSVCHKSGVTGRRNYKAMKSERFWEEIGRELTHNGR